MKAALNAWHELPQLLSAFSELATAFIESSKNRPVTGQNIAPPELCLSDSGMTIEHLVKQFSEHVVPNLSVSTGPRYWGFVTGGATPIATFADWLVSTYDQNVSKGDGSIATNIERQTIRWLTELFELPSSFDGLFTTGATAANYLGAVVARQFAGHQQGINVAEDGVFGLDVAVFCATPHASMLKALGLAGLGRNQLIRIKTQPNNEATDIRALELALDNSQAKSKIVIASAATVTGTDFDDLMQIRALCDKHQAWLHVDAAFGIFERVIHGANGRTKGIELADSITLDAHKWLNVPYDCGVFLTRHLDYLVASCDVPAPYLVTSKCEPDFFSMGVENSRRFRALPVWMSLLAYGKQGIRQWVGKNIDQAQQLADWFACSPDYELVYYGKLNVVLFKPKGQDDSATKRLLQAINADGRIFVSPGSWQGQKVIRAALSNWQTEQVDLDIAKSALTEIIKAL
ncbi:aspartate aminotransferase family protein [Pseudoalteromonas sp. SCSIO 43201]|uniref:pyridoxal phosphate-dependent decarboxylase family protein n=1 Tax=Pseudoalteromonas sp. SCSIO 43201 TaxID=2822842 RepID=UPI002074FD5D|nr:aminotransferase class I/II-fold pyridoxal phosphate-dependent enzyme [Pseudoalteromonas sp. SCSIO 43201]USD27402.1 aspartate aminotransferase family protein [Pseudoalteromonas sp. SCSIO 43201]